MRELLPIARWLPSYRRADLRYDVIAGVTVSALVVPKALGYAGIAQVPVENGLYAAAAGALIYAVFGTSRQISTGPSSALAAIAASAVAITGVASGAPTAQLVVAITLRDRVAVPARRGPADGVAVAAAVEAGDHRVPLRGGDRRRDRRAPQADRHERDRHEQLAGAGQLAANARRHPLDDARSSGSSPWSS